MRPKTPPNEKCPQLGKTTCQLVCKYNYFESDDLTINAYELKCLNCGWRDTIGYRSDEMDDEPDDVNIKQCPFCKLSDLCTGKNPCQGNPGI